MCTTSNFLLVAIVIMVLMVMVVMVVMLVMVVDVVVVNIVVRTGQDGTGRDRTKLTFKLDFPGNL